MILTVQNKIVSVLTGADLIANISAVNTKFTATGVTISVPIAGNIFKYEQETARAQGSAPHSVLFVIPQTTELQPYTSDDEVRAVHTIYVGIIMRDQSPDKLNTAKLMMAEAVAPALTKAVRDGSNIYQSIVRRIDYLPQYADGAFRWSDVQLTFEAREIILQEGVNP